MKILFILLPLALFISIAVTKHIGEKKYLFLLIILNVLFYFVLTWEDAGTVSGWIVMLIQLPVLIACLLGLFIGVMIRLSKKENTSLVCKLCGEKTLINWGDSSIVLCEECQKTHNQSLHSDARKSPRAAEFKR
jgi:hypothetical protein